MLDVHLPGTFLMSREIARGMVERRRDAIVNLSSIAGLTGLPRRNAYGAAKAPLMTAPDVEGRTLIDRSG